MSGDHEMRVLQDGILLMYKEQMKLTVQDVDPPEWQPPHVISFTQLIEDVTNDETYQQVKRRFYERIQWDGDYEDEYIMSVWFVEFFITAMREHSEK